MGLFFLVSVFNCSPVQSLCSAWWLRVCVAGGFCVLMVGFFFCWLLVWVVLWSCWWWLGVYFWFGVGFSGGLVKAFRGDGGFGLVLVFLG